jgi:hypothetical protein
MGARHSVHETVEGQDRKGGLDLVDERGGGVGGPGEPECGGEECDEEAGDRSRGSYGDECRARTDGGLEADDSAEGSAKRWSGQHVRQGGTHTVETAGEVVPELVREQDSDQCERERKAGGKQLKVVDDPVVGQDIRVVRERWRAEAEVVHVAHSDCGCGEHGDTKQQDGDADSLKDALLSPGCW